MNILITGTSRGLGLELARHYLDAGDVVFGISRGPVADLGAAYHHKRGDLAEFDAIVDHLDTLVGDAALDLVYLNAGVLGEIKELRDTALVELARVMNINVWSNKVILDWLRDRVAPPTQVVLLSSGAGVSGGHGWGAYALSKATLNMLCQLYAHELPHTHLLAFAPGLVHTDMQEYLQTVDNERFPAVTRLQQAMGTDAMPSAADAARRIAALTDNMRTYPSGSFVDYRKMLA